MAQSVTELAEALESVFDHAVVDGNDDELFASGYLRGHFDLVVAQLEMEGQQQASTLWVALDDALNKTRDELNPQDRQHVQNMLARLRERAIQLESA
ncbi:YfcL family protein [Aliidiomarina sanyensis]|uniref:YfcL family protein n=1 Tax=Aliidiomarina sanyensis TaxID=1249555 RepID=A0A432WDK2_9GAMM|nr:YfcL family protein [Aliidiomarina sanyensis]RUO30487.1 hypothetical protein CWE11_08930 [Aliidiomarina sanyensis]